jgi:hypothetical protein
MKTTLFSKKGIVLTMLFSALCIQGFAQSDIEGLFKSSQSDAQKLIQAYMNPFFKGMGTGLNSGWNNTAASKKLGRFELRFGLSGAMIPEKDKTFDVTKLGLSSNLEPSNPALVLSPTIGGEKTAGPSMNIKNGGSIVGTFIMPQGAKLPFVPAPQLQASIGLIKGLELTLRTMPTIKLGDKAGSVGMTGAGLKMNLLRVLAGKKTDKVLPFDLAAAIGYTKLSYNLPLDVQTSNSTYTDQMLKAKFTGVNVEAIISKKLAFFTPFASIGYQSAKTTIDLKGTFPFETGAQGANDQYTTIVDPIAISQKDISGLRTNLGFQLHLAFLRVYGSYSMGTYNSFNAGLGLGIGK